MTRPKHPPMNIWYRAPTLADLERCSAPGGDLPSHLDIRFTDVGDDYLRATMPVDERTRQPFGLLHGGASVALAETLGSVAANFCLDREQYVAVPQELNANHLRSARSGRVTGTARPVHIGKSSQVWDVRIEDDAKRLTCVSRVTLAVLLAASMAGCGLKGPLTMPPKSENVVVRGATGDGTAAATPEAAGEPEAAERAKAAPPKDDRPPPPPLPAGSRGS